MVADVDQTILTGDLSWEFGGGNLFAALMYNSLDAPSGIRMGILPSGLWTRSASPGSRVSPCTTVMRSVSARMAAAIRALRP